SFIEKGHKKIGLVSGPLEDPINGEEKFLGYRTALEDAGMAVDENCVAIGDYTYDSGSEAMEGFLELDEKPTAIFAGTDEMALGVIHAAQ
ncbi:substrate-binding domain-containing protein, partial [Micrococcus sp. SIMBA_131]